MTKIYRVGGMSCEGCAKSVTNALQGIVPEAVVLVDLENGTVTVEGIEDDTDVRQAIDAAGFDFNGVQE